MRLTKKYKEDYFVNQDNKELTKLDVDNDYNWCVHTKDRALTQEEYDLLKEVLL